MDDLAALGFQVDSAPLAKATSDLDKLARSAKGAEHAASGFAAGMSRSASSISAAFSAWQAEEEKISRALSVERINAANAGIAAYGAQLSVLRERYVPLASVQRKYSEAQTEINKAALMGAISEKEKFAALASAEAAYFAQVSAIRRAEQAQISFQQKSALTSHAMANLAFQVNDVATMAAMGVDPFRILATQAGQFYQILSMGEGGVKGSLGYLKDVLVGMVTPTRVAVLGLAGIATAGAAAAISWGNAQRDITTALVGVGSAAGLTADSINQISFAAAESGQMTVGAAREMALQFASTGQINEEVIGRLTSLGKGVAKIYGEDIGAAGERLARAFSDPAKGIDELNRRYGAFNDSAVQHIKSLTVQNSLVEAQLLMLDGITNQTRAAERATSDMARAWNWVKESATEYFNFVGQRSRLLFGLAEPFEQLADARARLQAAVSARDAIGDFDIGGIRKGLQDASIDNIREEVLRLELQVRGLSEASKDAAINLGSIRAADFVRGLVPDASAQRRLQDIQERIREIDSNPLVKNGMSPEALAALDKAKEQVRLQSVYFATASERAEESHIFAMRSIEARTTAQRAEIAYEQELLRLRREGDVNANEKANYARIELNEQAAEQVRRQNEQRVLSADQAIEQAQAELSLVGKTTAERELQLALLNTRHQLEAEALRMEGDKNAIDQKQRAALEERVRWQQALNKEIAYETALRDIAFERDQMGRSEREQRIYSQLNSMGALTDGKIVGAQAAMVAEQLRFNEVMKFTQDVTKDFTSGFVNDFKSGTDAVDALGNSLSRLGDKLIDMALDQAISGIFNMVLQGGMAAMTGGTSLAFTAPMSGMLSAPIFHRGGTVGSSGVPQRNVPLSVFDGAPRYHSGGIAGLRLNEVPAILERGERVIPNRLFGNAGGGLGWNGESITIPINIHIDAKGADAGGLERVREELASLKDNLPHLIRSTVIGGRERGYV
jgi:phage host-nuclease inhibitor protein Gam